MLLIVVQIFTVNSLTVSRLAGYSQLNSVFLPLPIQVHNLSYGGCYRTKSFSHLREIKTITFSQLLLAGVFLLLFV